MDKEELFRLQIMQDIISAYYRIPIRVMRNDAFKLAYNELKKTEAGFFDRYSISSEDDFKNFIIDFVEKLPNLYSEHISSEEIEAIKIILKSFRKENIKTISKKIFITYASFHPKLYRKLKREDTFFAMAIFLGLYISAKYDNKISDVRVDTNFAFDTAKFENEIVIIGPYCKEKSFNNFTKNLINIFDLDYHNFELEMLYESNNNKDHVAKVKEVFQHNIMCIIELLKEYNISQKDIKKMAMLTIYLSEKNNSASCISINNDQHIVRYQHGQYSIETNNGDLKETNISEIEHIIKKHYHFFQLEAFNSIGENLYNKFIPYESEIQDREEFKNAILKALRRLVYADAVLFYNYIEYNESFELLESDGLTNFEEDEVKSALNNINNNQKDKNTSLTYKIIDNYYKDKEVGLLINDVSNHDMIQPFLDKKIKSVLSIPLIFDHKIRGILHFFSYRQNAFDVQNKNFLFQFSDFLTHLMVESIFLKKQTDIIAIMNKENFVSDKQSKDLQAISVHIADAFAADGVMIFLDSRSVQDSATTRDSIHLVASEGFENIEGLSINEKDSLLGKMKENNTLIVQDIDKIEIEKMKYYNVFKENGIVSLIAITIKGANDRLEGAIVVVDRERRSYNAFARKMLNMLSEDIRLLNTINMHIYKDYKTKEKALHEIRQTFWLLTKQTKLFETRLNEDEVTFLNKTAKNNVFKNLEDIKIYAKMAMHFAKNFFYHNTKIKDLYEKLIEKDINMINNYLAENNDYIGLRDTCTRVVVSMRTGHNYNIQNNINPKIKAKIPVEMLNNIFVNIIGNAIKYRQFGTSISISAKSSGRYLNIHITNIGIQIKDEEQYRIFEKGVRGQIVKNDQEQDRWKEGSSENRGYGCYYVKTVICNSNWRGNFTFTEVNKKNNKFSENRFTIKFPIKIIKGVEDESIMVR